MHRLHSLARPRRFAASGYRCLCVQLLLLALFCVYGNLARAAIVQDLYEVRVAVADKTEMDQAFARAFSQVVLKVAGQEAAMEHPLLQEAAESARQYAAQYGYVGQEPNLSLEVSFVPAAIDRLLTQAELSVWGDNRPAVVVWLAVEQNGRRELLGSEGGSASLVAQLEERAAERGLPLVIPLMDLQDTSRVSSADVWGLFLDTVQEASARYAHDAVLVGRVYRGGEGLWSGRWQLSVKGEVVSDSASAGSANEVLQVIVDRVTENLAQRYTQSGEILAGDVLIEVADVASLADYAALTQYLSSLRPVGSAQPILVEGNRIRYRLSLVGSPEQLREYLALERRLRPELDGSPTEGAERILRYRWRP